jgi:hypothetical protein
MFVRSPMHGLSLKRSLGGRQPGVIDHASWSDISSRRTDPIFSGEAARCSK